MLFFRKKYSDKDIISGLKQDSDKIKRVAYEKLKPIVKGFFYKNYVQTNIDFEDIFSYTFLDFLKMVRKENFKLDAKLESIIIGIFKKRMIDAYRNKKQYILETLEDLNLTSESIEKTLFGTEIIQFVIKKLKNLGQNCFEILMKSAEGFNNEEIALQLGLANSKTVASRKYTCREKLKTAIKTDYPNIYNF